MSGGFGPWATAITPSSRSPLDAFWRRRMAMLTTIQHISLRPGRGQRARLALVAGLLLALPTASVVSTLPAAGPAAPQEPGRPPQPPGAGGAPPEDRGGGSPGVPGGPADWQVFLELKKAYALADGQLLRAVKPPFPAVRAVWLNDYVHRPLDEPQVLDWVGDQLTLDQQMPRGSSRELLRTLLTQPCGLAPQDVLDQSDLLSGHTIKADFVLRNGGDMTVDKWLDQFGAVLRQDLGIPAKVSLREVERPHVAVSGTFRPPLMPGTNQVVSVVIYGKEPPPAGTPEQRLNLPGFFQALSDHVQLPVVGTENVQVSIPPGGVMVRSGDGLGFIPPGPRGMGRGRGGRGAGTPGPGSLGPGGVGRGMGPGGLAGDGWGMSAEAAMRFPVVVRTDRGHDKPDAEAVLKHVAEQTGLTFRIEPRKVRALVVEKAG